MAQIANLRESFPAAGDCWRRLREEKTLAHRVAHLVVSGVDPYGL